MVLIMLKHLWHNVRSRLRRGFAFVIIATQLFVTPMALGAPKQVLVLGDSISAAYGMDLEQGWVALLQQHLTANEDHWTVINASISGDTTGGGLQRLPDLLKRHTPDIVVIELGGNDGLRGFPITKLRENLTTLALSAQKTGASVLLLSMEIPPNFGRRYTTLFRDSYSIVAEQTNATIAPFILSNIALDADLMQRDGIHPTASAQSLLLENVLPYVLPLVQLAESKP
jgi:acyl-CoA thioesterase-1